MLGGYHQGGTYGGRYRLGYMLTQFDVLTALSHEQMRTRRNVSPEFAEAVFENYIRNKLAKGKSRMDTHLKVEDLERGLPQFSRSFQLARQATGLPASRLFPPLQPAGALPVRTSTTTTSQRQRPTATQGAGVTAAITRNNPAVNRVSTNSRPAGTPSSSNPSQPQPDPESGDPDAPPPYSRTDPEPEATRMLEVQLNQVAEAGNGSGTVPVNGRDLAAEERERRELEVAMRESEELARQQEIHRREEEEAMADAAAAASASSSASERGSSSGILNSRSSHNDGPTESMHRRESSHSINPINQMTHSNLALGVTGVGDEWSRPSTHRRAVSDVGRGTPPPQGSTMDLENGLNSLTIPEDWDSNDSAASAGNLAEPLQPMPTGFGTGAGTSSKNPFLGPQQTGNSTPSSGMRSKNPFIDPPTVFDPTPTQDSRNRRDSAAGSVHTIHAPPVVPPTNTPGAQQTIYAPPPGPPPGHISTTTPGSRGPIGRTLSLTHHGGEDPLDMLRNYDTAILVDDSGSMAGGRWREAKKALMDVAEQAAIYDKDGIDVHFINDKRIGTGLTDAAAVENLFNQVKPGGSTPTGVALERILLDYMQLIEFYQNLRNQGQPIPPAEDVKPLNLIVITDGAPTDDPESVIVSVARRLDRGHFPLSQLGIQFVQIGSESEAREALQELDDNLSEKYGGLRDIVDTVPYSGQSVTAELILKTLLGGINRRIDRRD